MAKKTGSKWCKSGRKLLSLTLTGAMVLTMSAAALAESEVSTAEPDWKVTGCVQPDWKATGCLQPDWNEAGLRLLELMEENQDCPLLTEFMGDFQRGNMEGLTGEMPVVNVVEELALTAFEDDVVTISTAMTAPLNGIVATISGIAPMNAIGPNVSSDMQWSITVEMTNGVRTIAITGLGMLNPTGALEIPDTLIPLGERTPLSVTRIANNTFAIDGQFTSVSIPASVTQIGANAFANRTHLTTVTFRRATAPTIGANAFRNTALRTVRAPLGTLEAYRTRLSNAGTNVGVAGFRFIGHCRNDVDKIRCDCCAFRPGDVNGVGGVTVEDATLILNFLAGGSNSHVISGNLNSYNAALITNNSRNLWRPGLCDATQIMRSVVGLRRYYDRCQCENPIASCPPRGRIITLAN